MTNPPIQMESKANPQQLAAQIAQLRGLRNEPVSKSANPHLNRALAAARREPESQQPEISYIFIGISLPDQKN